MLLLSRLALAQGQHHSLLFHGWLFNSFICLFVLCVVYNLHIYNPKSCGFSIGWVYPIFRRVNYSLTSCSQACSHMQCLVSKMSQLEKNLKTQPAQPKLFQSESWSSVRLERKLYSLLHRSPSRPTDGRFRMENYGQKKACEWKILKRRYSEDIKQCLREFREEWRNILKFSHDVLYFHQQNSYLMN